MMMSVNQIYSQMITDIVIWSNEVAAVATNLSN